MAGGDPPDPPRSSPAAQAAAAAAASASMRPRPTAPLPLSSTWHEVMSIGEQFYQQGVRELHSAAAVAEGRQHGGVGEGEHAAHSRRSAENFANAHAHFERSLELLGADTLARYGVGGGTADTTSKERKLLVFMGAALNKLDDGSGALGAYRAALPLCTSVKESKPIEAKIAEVEARVANIGAGAVSKDAVGAVETGMCIDCQVRFWLAPRRSVLLHLHPARRLV